MKRPKVDTSGTEAAQAAVAAAQEQANNLRKNFGADLSNENITNVVAGGSAAGSETATTATRRRRQGSGLSSQLGLSV